MRRLLIVAMPPAMASAGLAAACADTKAGDVAIEEEPLVPAIELDAEQYAIDYGVTTQEAVRRLERIPELKPVLQGIADAEKGRVAGRSIVRTSSLFRIRCGPGSPIGKSTSGPTAWSSPSTGILLRCHSTKPARSGPWDRRRLNRSLCLKPRQPSKTSSNRTPVYRSLSRSTQPRNPDRPASACRGYRSLSRLTQPRNRTSPMAAMGDVLRDLDLTFATS